MRNPPPPREPPFGGTMNRVQEPVLYRHKRCEKRLGRPAPAQGSLFNPPRPSDDAFLRELERTAGCRGTPTDVRRLASAYERLGRGAPLLNEVVLYQGPGYACESWVGPREEWPPEGVDPADAHEWFTIAGDALETEGWDPTEADPRPESEPHGQPTENPGEAFLRAQARHFAYANTPWFTRARNPKGERVEDYWTGEEIELPPGGIQGRWESNGYTIYRGPSLYDGKPIVVLATGFLDPSRNVKTGRMIQTWILREDLSPQDAVWSGEDDSICGSCIHRGTVGEHRDYPRVGKRVEKSKVTEGVEIREGGHLGKQKRLLPKSIGRSCYVVVSEAPLNVWKQYHRGKFPYKPIHELASLFSGAFPVRIGSYGDPVVVPIEVWQAVLTHQVRWTGYTAQWRRPEAQPYRQFLQASVSSPQELREAHKLGWDTFRIGRKDEPKIAGVEIICPATPEGGYRVTCDACALCMGVDPRKKNPDLIECRGCGDTFSEIPQGFKVLARSPGYVVGLCAACQWRASNPGDEELRALERAARTGGAAERMAARVVRARAGDLRALLELEAWERTPVDYRGQDSAGDDTILVRGPGGGTELRALEDVPTQVLWLRAGRRDPRRDPRPGDELLKAGTLYIVDGWANEKVYYRTLHGASWGATRGRVDLTFYRPMQSEYSTALVVWQIAMREVGDFFVLEIAELRDRPLSNPGAGHDHPRLPAPISREQAEAELAAVARHGGFQAHEVAWTPELALTHEREPRRYAQVVPGAAPRFELAEQLRWLPVQQRHGLYAHEVGHALAPTGSEDDADRAALEWLGARVEYDLRWPGKGLQTVNPPTGDERARSLERAADAGDTQAFHGYLAELERRGTNRAVLAFAPFFYDLLNAAQVRFPNQARQAVDLARADWVSTLRGWHTEPLRDLTNAGSITLRNARGGWLGSYSLSAALEPWGWPLTPIPSADLARLLRAMLAESFLSEERPEQIGMRGPRRRRRRRPARRR